VDGLTDLIRHYKLDMKVTQLVNLVSNALIIEKEVKVPKVEAPVPEAWLEGHKILVTDDEPDLVTFISAVLEDNGATVLKAYDGEEAIEIAQKENPDLITLDISMPGKSGAEVFEHFRTDQKLKSIPICIITGKPELRKLIYENPLDPPEGFLDKPVNEEALLLNIRKILKVGHHQKMTGKN
jgi:CheY-like chemotaxis protein